MSTMTWPHIQTTLLTDKVDDELPNASKNSAAAGLQLFQVFSSTSALLGLSRSSDYSATNAALNSMIVWRRNQGLTSQSNMWGEVRGTGLAGGGTGASGQHGKETIEVRPRIDEQEAKQAEGDMPAAFYQTDPATADLRVAHREQSSPTIVENKMTLRSAEAGGFAPVRGLQVSLKTREKSDKVLVIANLPTFMVENHEGATWTLKRGNYEIGPAFESWTHELGRLEHVLMPWLDEPEKARLELEYTAQCRLKGSVQVSKDQDRRQLTAIVLPGGQVTSARSHETVCVQPGRWFDVPGLQQISVVNPQEKVLVVCSVKYCALWSDEQTRGRFTILRDGAPLDRESYGLQSVRALQKGLKRSLVMVQVDDPEPGPHLYAAKAAVTTGDENQAGVCRIEDERQLALIRLPAQLVFGPARCEGETLVEEDRWTEVKGLSVTATVGQGDKVLVVYSVNFNPAGLSYEAYFTLFRSSATGSMNNLGSEQQGMCSVASSAAGSSEFPVAMFTDSPGAGSHTYTVCVRTRRCDNLTEPAPVEVGPDGQLSAVLLPSARRSGGTNTHSLLEQMAAEMQVPTVVEAAGAADASETTRSPS